MNERLVRLAKRSKWSSIALYALFNQRARRRARLDTHGQSRDVSVAESVDYVLSAFRAILGHAGLSPADLAGMRVLELGPGDNLGLALRFLAAGAAEVVTLDRFELERDPRVEQAIYGALLERLAPEERKRAELERLRAITGVGIEEAAELLDAESFDLILSVAVLEHVDDLDGAFTAMDRLLRPGGLLLHEVDFRDHTMFTGGGQHPLTFLTVPRGVWRAITSHWGGPNRRLIDHYRSQVDRLGYEARFDLSHVLAEDVADRRRLIERVRPKLQPEFRDLPDEDLATTGVFMVARKPSGTRTRYSPSPHRSSSAS